MMKYVSVTCTSTASAARNRPVSPPSVNNPMKPMAYSIGVSHEIEPLYIVAVQLNTFTADGMATRKLRIEKIIAAYTDSPATNMWWPHTRKPSTAIARLAKATNEYPNTCLRQNAATSSLTTPIAGSTMM